MFDLFFKKITEKGKLKKTKKKLIIIESKFMKPSNESKISQNPFIKIRLSKVFNSKHKRINIKK